MRAGGLDLADLLDVELQMLRDRDLGRDELRRRDRHIGLAIDAGTRDGDPAQRKALLGDWVRAVHDQLGQESAGQRIVRVYQALGWMLALLGLSTGAGTAATVLAYDGTRPVNVIHFLAVFVGLQLLLLLSFALSALLFRFRVRLPLFSFIYGLLRLLVDAVANLFERRLSAERRSLLRAARGRLRSRAVIYGDLERWLLVSLAQRFGVAFNLGALATCLYLIAFSDLAFAWQTTLDVSAGELHRVTSVLAAPWSWLYPEGAPSLDVVRAARYFRLDASFGQAASATSAELLGQWWRFLVLCLFSYGLAPRLLLSLFSHLELRQALTGLRLDHGDIASLRERLISPVVETRSPDPELGPPSEPGPTAPAARQPAARGGPAAVVVWGDVPLDRAQAETLIIQRFGWAIGLLEAAGVDDTRSDAAAIQALAGGGDRAPIVVVVEAFEAPTREARSFIQRLRQAVGSQRPMVIGLLDTDGAGHWSGPAAADLRMWQKPIAALGDPYLRVEALVEEP